LDTSAQTAADPLSKNKFVGFLSVTAVTFFEEAFKDILHDFARRKHPVFGAHVKAQYEKLNGRISLKDIRKDHIPKFGEKYQRRFDSILDRIEKEKLRSGDGSVKSSYGNILTWRHSFVHGGIIPINATYEEAKRSYDLGKEIMHCLNDALRR
jgi:hypothetical protein